jgi:D-alanyl-D-alanine carboxypeptidase/D-alanyl-D-alanine-endopeptidase (penicillin-binding protein 4)
VRRVVRRRIVAASGLAVVLLAGYTTLDVYDVVPGMLTRANPPDPAPATVPTPTPTTTVAQPRSADAGMPLAASGQQQPVPTAAGVQAAVATALTDPALAGNLGATVRDAATGTHLLDLNADTPLIPASNLKLLSAAAVAATFPVDATFTTRVVQGPSSDQVVLVAGGDTLLNPGPGDPNAVAGRAGLGDLVSATSAALKAQGVAKVSVSLDVTRAPGPLLAPTWSASFRPTGITGAVASIGLSSQRVTPGRPGPADPAASVAAAFVAGLTAQGVAATATAPAAAPEGARTLASVTSAPVLDQLGLALQDSDDALTESLTRQAAYRSGTAPGFAEAAAFVRTTVAGLGVDITGVSTVDASGLSRENVVPARVVADVIALGQKLPALNHAMQEMAVAGLSGTLEDRFTAPDTRAAAGIFRGKTGTLTGVNALGGTVVTADGRLLVVDVISNTPGPGRGTTAVRAALDRVIAVLASCGCR